MNMEICRLCYKNEGVIHIFNGIPDLQTKIILVCRRLTIAPGDGLPANICGDCDAQLSAAHQFVLKCEASDRRLHALTAPLNTDISPEDYKPKVEVKLEQDSTNDLSDFEDDYSLKVVNGNSEIKLEQEVITKSSYKKQKKLKNGTFDCSVCGRVCSNRSTLASHMKRHTKDTPYSCHFCNKKYKDQGTLKRHVDRNHLTRERNFICETCGKGFFSKNDVKIHLRTHTGETPYACSECPTKFTQFSALVRHKQRHSGLKPHECLTCSKCFRTKDDLTRHLLVHGNEKKYLCSICKVPFKYPNNLKKHMQIHSSPNSFICSHCGKCFNQKGNLQSHTDRWHSEKSGCCHICSKNVSNIEVHMWKHNGQRPLKCELCSSSFFDAKSRARHVNYRHKNPDKFKCAYGGCQMTFPSRPMLDFHIAKSHETSVPFPCDRCSRGFYRKNDLARHKIGTHKERLL